MKKLLSLLLASAVALSIGVPAYAAVGNTGFADVAADAWYAEAAEYVCDNGLMSGTTDTTFAPSATMTRAMLAAVVYRTAGFPAVTETATYTDVATGSWYSNAVYWAAQNSIIGGYGNGLFGVNEPVTREQIATILWRYAKSPAAETSAGFADQSSISSFAVSAVNWAKAGGIVGGKDGNRFDPTGNATRAEVAVILMRYLRNEQPAPTPTPAPADVQKVLVAYFSCTNTTKALAESIADGLDATLYEITPETPYTSADLDYNNSSSRSIREMNDPNSRPAISGSVADMEQYDIVFIGYPIWSGLSPRIISTFLKAYGFDGKTIVPFCPSGSSGIGSSATALHSLAGGAEWLAGQRFSGGTSRAAMVDWVNGLGLDITAN